MSAKTTTATTTATKPPNHLARGILAVVLGTIAVILILMSVMVSWLGSTLTNTDKYVDTVGPLISSEAVQNFAAEQVSGALLHGDEEQIRVIASQLIDPATAQNTPIDPLRSQVEPLVEEEVRAIVSNDTFVQLWTETNRQVHGELISQLDSEQETVTLDFRPMIDGLIDQLDNTALASIKDNAELEEDAGKVEVEGAQIQNLRDSYDNFQRSRLTLIVLAVLATAATVAVSVHHVKTLRHVALATGILSGLVALLLVGIANINSPGSGESQQNFVVALVSAFTKDLRTMLTVVSVASFVIVVATILWQKYMPRPATNK